MEQDGQDAADYECLNPRVGAVVRPRRIGSIAEHVHGTGGCKRNGNGHEHQRSARTAEYEYDERPEQIELFLDCERPEVLERRWFSEEIEVTLLGEYESPVRNV